MFGAKSNYISLEFRTVAEVLADEYISNEAKFATKVKYELSQKLSDISVDKDDDERQDITEQLQYLLKQQESDDGLLQLNHIGDT